MPLQYDDWTTLFPAIADAIREKKDTSAGIVADNFPSEIRSISDTGENGLLLQLLQREVTSNVIFDDKLTIVYISALEGVTYTNGGNIEFAEFDNVTAISRYGIAGTNKMLRTKFNKSVTVGDNAFRENPNIKVVDFAAITASGAACFRSCTSLEAFIIRSNSLCPMTRSDFISNSGTTVPANMKFYVPPDLVSSYQSASNWSMYSSSFHPFYIASTVSDIDTLLASSDVPVGALIICDAASYSQKYTVKETT